MNDRDQRRYDRLTRIQTFGNDNAADFAVGSIAKTHFQDVDGHIAELDDARAGKPARVSKETIIEALWLDSRPIGRTAKIIGRTENGFAAPYLVPENNSEDAITAHVDNLLKLLKDDDRPVNEGGDTPEQKAAKAALRARFIAYELPADFVEDLHADREALREANQHNQSENQGGVEDTARIGIILKAAGLDVEALDTIMLNKYARDGAKLAAWESASRLERAPKRKGDAPASGGNTPTK